TVKLYNSDTPEAEKRADFASFEQAMVGVDVLIYTPTLSCGVSLEKQPFDVMFGWFKSMTGVDVETCRQMMHRIRDIREKSYYVLLDLATNRLPETKAGVEEFVSHR